jgi:hypothetical protein
MRGTTRQRRTYVSLAAAFAMGAGALVATATGAGALPGDPGDIGTGGSYSGTGGPRPVIECSWALPDYDGNWDTGMQYGQDDDPTNGPIGGPPCKFNDGLRPSQGPQGPVHIKVLPNIDDKPTLQWIELWSAVDTPDNITDVSWRIFHPDGSLKVQVHGYRYDTTQARCVGPTGMFTAAGPLPTGTGQIDALAIANGPGTDPTNDDDDSIRELCQQRLKGLWYGAFGLSKHQPYGIYRVEAIATGNTGTTTLNYNIQVLPVIYLATDFATVSFNGLVIGNNQIGGDTNWGSLPPTVQSQGNEGITVEMQYDPLCLSPNDLSPANCHQSKRIDTFDGGFGTDQSKVTHVFPVRINPDWPRTGADTDLPVPTTGWTSFLQGNPDDRYRTLCPNDLGKVDFSVHVPLGKATGTYVGKVRLRAVANHICDTDNGSVYDPTHRPDADPLVRYETTFDGTTPWATAAYL